MAAYIQLISKKTNEPVSFADIDNEMCSLLGVEPDADKYYCSWYDFICFRLALGQTFEKIRNEWLDPAYKDLNPRLWWILAYIEKNYTPQAWRDR